MINFAILISSIKLPLGIPLFFNAFTIPLGLISLIKLRFFNRRYFYLILLLFCGIVGNALYNLDYISAARTLQVFILLLFSVYVSRNIYSLDKKMFKFFIIMMIFIFILECLFNIRYYREFLGVTLPRLSGSHGDPNFNSVLIGAIVCLYFFRFQDKSFTLLALIILIIPGFSRSATLGLIAFFLTICFYGKLVKLSSLILLIALLLQPLYLESIFNVLSDETIQQINYLSSGRLAHWQAYYEIAKNNSFGVGYFIGQTIEANYIDLELFPNTKPQQAHSMVFSTIADFGTIGYAIFSLFFLSCYKYCKEDKVKLGILNYILLSFMSLNFLGEISFWLLIATLLSKKPDRFHASLSK